MKTEQENTSRDNAKLFQEELQRVSTLMERTLKEDGFPSGVVPEYLRDAVTDYPCRGGKRLRPALTLWTCGLFGGDPESAGFAAAAAEIYHNWTLVHDDIIDGDEFRRGVPTEHIRLAAHARKKLGLKGPEADKFGRDIAILAGDIQQGWAVETLLKSVCTGTNPQVAIILCSLLQRLVNRRLISGECLDIEFPFRKWSSLKAKDIEAMYAMKTGALLKFCALSGALVAIDDPGEIDSKPVKDIGTFAESAGIAFQLKDDWLGLFADEKETGKPGGSDLSTRKPTVMMLKAFELCGRAEKELLAESLGKSKYSAAELQKIRNIVRNSGAEKAVLSMADKYKRKSLDLLGDFPDGKYRRLLAAWTEYVLGRRA